MLLYTCGTIDSKTNYPIIASELSFNMACSYLADTKKRPITSVKKGDTIHDYIFYEGDEAKYIYDEIRGYLLQIDATARELVGKDLFMPKEEY